VPGSARGGFGQYSWLAGSFNIPKVVSILATAITEGEQAMRFWKAFMICGILGFLPITAYAQREIEADPTAYALSGYSVHIADAIFDGKSRLQLGAFAAETPEWVHGNSGWTEKSHGVTFKFDYFPLQPLRGLFIGLDSNYARVRYTLRQTNEKAYQNIVSLGPRIGYRFQLGEHLYVSPWISVDYQFNAEDVVLSGKTFEQGKLAVFPAVHVGWRF
jgi:hypothetical protein